MTPALQYGGERLTDMYATKKICIIHYNTPFLTDKLIRSINKYTPDTEIYVFDNSDTHPFVNNFSNVTVFDNTKGNIINFSEWLARYPSRNLSFGRFNNWASAKHCYTVQKCIDLIRDNFVLVDSDVIITKDISHLFDRRYVYVGETIRQPRSNIKRVVPYLCFINVKMCLGCGIKYFNPDYMHGLAYTVNNKKADQYDTGSAFYLGASRYRHKEIVISDYCVHYGSGSWAESKRAKYGDRSVPKLTPEEWVEKYKSHWEGVMDTLQKPVENAKKRGVVYTCITGGYELLDDPYVVSPDFDYVCFTNFSRIKSDIWQIRPIPEELDGYSEVKKQRCIKIMPHKFLPEYDLSIWVDGSVKLKKDVGSFVDKYCVNGNIFIPRHPQRDCIYNEMDVCIKIKKDTAANILPMKSWYKQEGFPEHYGLVQTTIMVRRHNEPDCVQLMEAWWNNLKDHSHRDQLSFDYVRWKNPEIRVTFLDKSTFKNAWFSWERHKKPGKPIPVSSNSVVTHNIIPETSQKIQTVVTKAPPKPKKTEPKYRSKIVTESTIAKRREISDRLKTFLRK